MITIADSVLDEAEDRVNLWLLTCSFAMHDYFAAVVRVTSTYDYFAESIMTGLQ